VEGSLRSRHPSLRECTPFCCLVCELPLLGRPLSPFLDLTGIVLLSQAGSPPSPALETPPSSLFGAFPPATTHCLTHDFFYFKRDLHLLGPFYSSGVVGCFVVFLNFPPPPKAFVWSFGRLPLDFAILADSSILHSLLVNLY